MNKKQSIENKLFQKNLYFYQKVRKQLYYLKLYRNGKTLFFIKMFFLKKIFYLILILENSSLLSNKTLKLKNI